MVYMLYTVISILAGFIYFAFVLFNSSLFIFCLATYDFALILFEAFWSDLQALVKSMV